MPKGKLTYQLYSLLFNFWGIIDKWCWVGDLISPMGTHRIRWMPQLCNDWRRLTYNEFLLLYSVPRMSPREGMPERKEWRYRTKEESEELEERTNRAIDYLENRIMPCKKGRKGGRKRGRRKKK